MLIRQWAANMENEAQKVARLQMQKDARELIKLQKDHHRTPYKSVIYHMETLLIFEKKTIFMYKYGSQCLMNHVIMKAEYR